MTSEEIIACVKEITVAIIQNSNIYADAQSGKDTANFMQQIYDKLCELKDENSN